LATKKAKDLYTQGTGPAKKLKSPVENLGKKKNLRSRRGKRPGIAVIVYVG